MKTLGVTLVAMVAWTAAALAAEPTWMTDLAKAQALAKDEKKMVLMDFTGSDWCPACKNLHNNVFTSKTFADFASSNLVLVVVDFPTGKPMTPEQRKANEALAKKFKVEALPTVVVLSPSGKQLSSEVGYMGASADEFVAKLKKLKGES